MTNSFHTLTPSNAMTTFKATIQSKRRPGSKRRVKRWR